MPIVALRILGPHPVLHISNEEFAELTRARETLVSALDFEQRFELLINNWMKWELECVSWALKGQVEGWVQHAAYDRGFQIFSEANRLAANLLSTARAYIDGVKHSFRSCDLDPPFEQRATARFRQAYDESWEYRFLEALRNSVQHRGQAVSGTQTIHKRKEAGHWAESFRLKAGLDMLREDPGFKKKVLQELTQDVDLRSAIYEYVARLTEIHLDLRVIAAAGVSRARAQIEEITRRYKELEPETIIALHAFEHDNRTGRAVFLNLDWDDVRVRLEQRFDGQLRLSLGST